LKPKDVEKKQFGEVFTPFNLVNEMLDKLPTNVWTNKNLKWLDPASGMGNFPIAVYLRLMIGLKDEIKDDKLRKKHILENMLYMCELNKKNVLVCKQIFDINDDYKLNLYQSDSLKIKLLNIFGLDKFDIILSCYTIKIIILYYGPRPQQPYLLHLTPLLQSLSLLH
jgi:type I restriction-modification system DNA methylase subunit